jgi:decaprenylphospho-beta-D-ribofuranose 2-oxidase
MRADLLPEGAPAGMVELSGWGRTAASAATLCTPADARELVAAVRRGPDRGVIARGLGRSYGDPAQNAGGLVVSTAGLTRVTAVDAGTRTITVESGVTIGSLLRALAPHGLVVPVTPGTRSVTVGGAIAADVHGKNHHRDGSFGRHVQRMTLLLADGTCRQVGPEPGQDPELFWATLGGMGLTGVVLDATLSALRVETPWMSVDTRRAADFDELLDALAEADRRRYSVAWVDCLSAGRSAGRGVVTSGDHAGVEEVAAWGPRDHPDPDPPPRLATPGWVPPGLLNRWALAALNAAWFRRAPIRAEAERQTPSAFFHPLDGIAGWNGLYGSGGLVQYQCVVPDPGTLADVLGTLRAARVPAFLAVLKKFGAGNPGPLSFPRPGWTLALDVPASIDGLPAVLDRLDETVADAGGSIYLAKDSRMRPELVRAFYPRLDEWSTLRDRVDPDRRWQSDLSRRLAL